MANNGQGFSIEEFKNQLNIVDVIGRVVPLKRAGSNYKGICPFHNEKTPSFVVSEQKQIFTCFGCGVSGNVIEFAKRYYNLEFKEAVEKLAKENGVTVNFTSTNPNKEKYYLANRDAAKFFFNALFSNKNPGYTYMRGRGIDDDTLKKFGIGYADENWDSLYKHLKEKGHEDKIILQLGLVFAKNGNYYDMFRNRVMFPIINTGGKVIGFGGRAMGNGMPKYLNSPENMVFQKKNNLFALNTTKQDIGKEGYAILVEGYMDAISLYQHGVKNVGASLGTALTDAQAILLKRYSDRVVLSYDSDSAGRKAALRGIDVLRNHNFKVKVLHVDDGKDPDEFIKKKGHDAFIKLVENAVPMIDYKFQAISSEIDLNSDEGKIEYMKKAAEVLKKLSPVEADIYIKKLANELKISEGAIRLEIEGNNKPADSFQPDKVSKVKEENGKKLSTLEATILKVLPMVPSAVSQVEKLEGIFESQLAIKTFDIIREKVSETDEGFACKEIFDYLDPQDAQVLKTKFDNIIVGGKEEQLLGDCIDKWKETMKRKAQQDLIDRLSLSDEETDKEATDILTERLMKTINGTAQGE